MARNTRTAGLVRRLNLLWTLELFNSFFLPAVMVSAARQMRQPVGPLVIYSAAMLALLLWQGTAWWLTMRGAVRSGPPGRVGARALRPFRVFKRVNWVLLALLPVALGVEVLVAGRLRLFALLAGGACWVLAVLEQVNYYYRQLMYDNPSDLHWLLRNRRLKRSTLARALQRRR
jgi:hypothetical protein